jgi:hypothetical protein
VAEQASDGFAEAYAAVARDTGLQTRFSVDAPTVEHAAPPVATAAEPGLNGALTVAGVLLLGAILLFVACHLATGRPGWRRAPRPPAPPGPRPAHVPAPPTLDRAEALAADGRFTEAVHALLAMSLARLAASLPALRPPALTGRDIARSPALAPEARAAIGGIVAQVERGIFAGRTLAEADYAACRALYQRLAGLG